MKIVAVFLGLGILTVAQAAEAKSFSANKYVYMGELTQLVDLLQSELAAQMLADCGGKGEALVSDLKITVKRGSLAGRGPVEAWVEHADGKPLVLLPSHPFVELSANYQCR